MTRVLAAFLILILAIPVLLTSILGVVVQGLAYFCAGFARGLMQPGVLLRKAVRNLELTRPQAPLPSGERRGCGGPPLCYDWNCTREDGHP